MNMQTPEVETSKPVPSTVDLASIADPRDERPAPLFSSEIATGFRAQWNEVQSGFVDDPKLAVRNGDELVARVMSSLTESFSKERARLEGQLEKRDESTENLRVALRQYRSFFDRLLNL